MKRLLSSFLFFGFLISFIGMVRAETIVEYDGAFSTSDWSITAGFVGSNNVVIYKGAKGILTIENTALYKDITVKILYKKVNNSYSNATSCDLKLIDNNNQSLTKTNVISDNTGSTTNVLIVKFNNATGFQLQQLVYSNPNKNATIVYLKITGTKIEGPTSGINKEKENPFSLTVLPHKINIKAKRSGKVKIYSMTGQILEVKNIKKGKNTIRTSSKGIKLIIITDEIGQIIKRLKVVQQIE